MSPLVLDLLKTHGALTIREVQHLLQIANPSWVAKDRQALRSACLNMLESGLVFMDLKYRLHISTN